MTLNYYFSFGRFSRSVSQDIAKYVQRQMMGRFSEILRSCYSLWGCKFYIGQNVEVIAGRKAPIGTIARLESVMENIYDTTILR